jgi:hypothetical protein
MQVNILQSTFLNIYIRCYVSTRIETNMRQSAVRTQMQYKAQLNLSQHNSDPPNNTP